MKKTLLLCLILLFIQVVSVNCQNAFVGLNSLPKTLEVRAPVFNTVKQYSFEIDSVKNNIFIQDRRLSSADDNHFYQWMYEIPIDDLGGQSFSVLKKGTEPERIVLSIKTSKRQNSIMTYMFQNDGVSSIMAGSAITLGEWVYSDSLFSYLETQVKSLNRSFNASGLDEIVDPNTKGGFKFVAQNVEKRNVKFTQNLTIGDGYYFKQLIEPGSSYTNNNLARKLNKYLMKLDVQVTYPIPVVLYTKGNEIEYFFVVNPFSKKYFNKEELRIKSFDGGDNQNKYVFMINKNVL